MSYLGDTRCTKRSSLVVLLFTIFMVDRYGNSSNYRSVFGSRKPFQKDNSVYDRRGSGVTLFPL